MVLCNLCNKVMFGNMPRHLRCVHPKAYMQWQKLKKNRKSRIEDTSDSCKQEILDKGRKRSSIWSFFEDIGDDTFKCKMCAAAMKYNKSRHLQLRHPEVHKQWQNIRKSTNEFQWLTTDNPAYLCNTRRGWVKQYLKKVGDNKYECNLCHKVLKMPNGDYSNMKRHVRRKHPFFYEKEMSAYIEPGRRQMSEDASNCEVIEYVVEDADSNDPLLSSDAILSAIENNQFIVSDEENTSPETDTESPPKESKIPKKIKLADIESFVRAEPQIEQKIKELCVQDVEGARQKTKTCFWNFFIAIVEDNLYRCLFCEKEIAIFPKSVGNLKRHMASKHPIQYELILKHAPLYDTCKNKKKTFNYVVLDERNNMEFDVLDQGCFKCKTCGIMIVAGNNLQVLTNHLKDTHPEKEYIETGPIVITPDSDLDVHEEVEV